MTALSDAKRYQAYPEYKDSGVEWSDTLPLSWGAVNLRWISTIYAGGTPSKTNQSFWENGTVPWINSGAVNQGLVTKTSTLITEQAYQNSSAKWIPKGSLVVALAGQGKTKGMVAQLAIDSTCNQSMAAIVPECSEHSRYLYWWLTSNYQNIRNMAGGDLRDGLNLEHLGSIQCPQPSVDESVSIANFLDHETAKIDTLIEKQQQLIKLLKEKRQAVISHAVTKGLNPQAPMKDSGVEWLGEVPEHWVVSPIKHLLRQKKGAVKAGPFGSHLKNSDMDGGDVKVITQKNVIKKNLSIGDSFISEQKYRELSGFTIEKEDVLITTRGTIGRTCVYSDEAVAILHPCLIRMQCDETKVIPELLALIIQDSGYAMEQILVKSNATTIEVIYSDNLVNTEICVPKTIDEQVRLLEFVELETDKFDSLVRKAESAISLMQERRTALISAAVTGKIDVRNWQAPTSQEQVLGQTA
ncbi:TPA: restriction endonuclease subunit S [Vibrio parahaemolyticus]|nr:restriction endonuclease subunit S [Vibrio parahaemolyticus]